MKLWAMTFLILRGKIGPLCEMLEKKVTTLALQVWCETLSQYEKILELNDQKRRVVNLKVLQERMLGCISEAERTILLQYAGGESMQAVADKAGISKSGVSRKIDVAMYKCVRELNRLGYSEKRLKEEYGDIALVERTRKKLKRSAFGQNKSESVPKQGETQSNKIGQQKDGRNSERSKECALRYPVRGEPLAAYPPFCGIKEA